MCVWVRADVGGTLMLLSYPRYIVSPTTVNLQGWKAAYDDPPWFRREIVDVAVSNEKSFIFEIFPILRYFCNALFPLLILSNLFYELVSIIVVGHNVEQSLQRWRLRNENAKILQTMHSPLA